MNDSPVGWQNHTVTEPQRDSGTRSVTGGEIEGKLTSRRIFPVKFYPPGYEQTNKSLVGAAIGRPAGTNKFS